MKKTLMVMLFLVGLFAGLTGGLVLGVVVSNRETVPILRSILEGQARLGAGTTVFR